VFRHRPLCLSAFRCSAIFGHLPAFGFHLCVIASLVAAGCNGSTSAAGPGGGSRAGRGRGGDGGPAPVVTAKVVEKDVPLDLAAIGNVEAYTTISVRSQITGQLQEALFREGDVVKKGEQLFTIDRRPFEAALLMAEANLTRDKALLAQAEAQLARDASNAEYQQLTSERLAQLQQRASSRRIRPSSRAHRPTRRARSSTPTRRTSRARRRSSQRRKRRSTTRACSSATPSSGRQSTAVQEILR